MDVQQNDLYERIVTHPPWLIQPLSQPAKKHHKIIIRDRWSETLFQNQVKSICKLILRNLSSSTLTCKVHGATFCMQNLYYTVKGQLYSIFLQPDSDVAVSYSERNATSREPWKWNRSHRVMRIQKHKAVCTRFSMCCASVLMSLSQEWRKRKGLGQ